MQAFFILFFPLPCLPKASKIASVISGKRDGAQTQLFF